MDIKKKVAKNSLFKLPFPIIAINNYTLNKN